VVEGRTWCSDDFLEVFEPETSEDVSSARGVNLPAHMVDVFDGSFDGLHDSQGFLTRFCSLLDAFIDREKRLDGAEHLPLDFLQLFVSFPCLQANFQLVVEMLGFEESYSWFFVFVQELLDRLGLKDIFHWVDVETSLE
jgi:hypothetical protein